MEIERFGPIEGLELEVREGLYVTFGVPGSGKSYLLKLIFMMTRLYMSPLLGGSGDVEGAVKFMLKELFGDKGEELFRKSKVRIEGERYALTLEGGKVEVEERAGSRRPTVECEPKEDETLEVHEPNFENLSTWSFIVPKEPRNDLERLALLVAGLLPGASSCRAKVSVPVFTGRGYMRGEIYVDVVWLPFSLFLPHGRSFIIEHYSLSQEYPMTYSEFLKLYKQLRYRVTVYPWLKGLEENKETLAETAVAREVMKRIVGGEVSVSGGKLVFKKGSDEVKVHASADAVKEMVAIASAEVLVRRSPFSYLFVEEPENQLHPSAQRALTRVLAKLSNIIMITTHSPFVIVEACLASDGRATFIHTGKEPQILTCKDILNEIPDISSVSFEQLEEVSEKWNIIMTAKR